MKRLLLPLLALAAPACQKATVDPESECVMPEWRDSWHWVSSVGGLSGRQNETPASTGTTLTWQFRSDSTVLAYTTRQGVAQPTDTLRYSRVPVRSIFSGGQLAPGLTLTRRNTRSVYVVRQWTPQLVLAENYPDGFVTTFTR